MSIESRQSVFPVTGGQDWTFDGVEEMYLHIERIAREKYEIDHYTNQIEIISSEQMLDAYCITLDHKLLRNDFIWVEAKYIQEGDIVLGFDENGPHRKFRNAKVLHVQHEIQPVFEVTLSSGKTFKVTNEHKWLIREKRGITSRLKWVNTQELRDVNSRYYPSCVPHVIEVWDSFTDFDSGWISGMLDGEGTTLKNTLQKLNYTQQPCLNKRVDFDIFGAMKTSIYEDVVSINAIGNLPIAKITTSTGTFVCDGYPMHNCAVGLPIMYEHWSFGKEFVEQNEVYRRGYRGLAYEIVINSAPCISYCMEENSMLMHTLVMAHAAVGHNSFFKGNYLFRQWTDAESIIDYLVFAKKYIKEQEELHGYQVVEDILDAAHAIMSYGVDKYQRPPTMSVNDEKERELERAQYIQEQLNVLWSTIPKADETEVATNDKDRFPKEPQENLLYFIEKNAPRLEPWEREILRIMRKIAQYFYPQRQTQLMNEGWACVTGNTLIDTPFGLIRADELVDTKYNKTVDDGNTNQQVVNWFPKTTKKRVKITLKNGLELHGGRNHKILVGSEWIELQNIHIGDILPVVRGRNEWSTDYVSLQPFFPASRLSVKEICNQYDTDITTFYKWKNNTDTISYEENIICQNIAKYLSAVNKLPTNKELAVRTQVTLPDNLDEDFAYWLGLITGDGGIHGGKHKRIYFVSGDHELRDWFCAYSKKLGVNPTVVPDRNHWVVTIYSSNLISYLTDILGFSTGKTSDKKTVPVQLLKSPRSVVSSFIRGHMDTDGCCSKQNGNVILISKSKDLISVEQQLLLKMGIISSVSYQIDDCYRLTITGTDRSLFRKMIGFGLKRKQLILDHFEDTQTRYLTKADTSEVVNVLFDTGNVYDFSVNNTHQYKASCFINHNCFWHYTLMHDLFDEGLVDTGGMFEFYESHTGAVFQPEFDDKRFSGINVYALGFAMFQDIKRICMEPTDEDRKWFDWAGNGDWVATVKFAMKNFKDESFVAQYLSPKIVRDFRLFTVFDDEKDPQLEITEISDDRSFRNLREKLAAQYNIGYHLPDIQVTRVERWGDRTLTLGHNMVNDRPLEPKTATEVLKYVSQLWGYDVRMESLDQEGKVRACYDVSEDETLLDIFMNDD